MVLAALSPRRLTAAAALAAGFAAAVFAAGLWFIRAERLPPTFDDAWYLENACRFYHALREEGFWAFAKEYAEAFRFKAPLISVIPLPAFFALGPSHDAALLANLLSLPVLAFYLFRIGRLAFNDAAGGLAVGIALTMPMLFGLSRRFFVESWLTAAVAATVWYLLASDAFRRAYANRVLGVLLGLGLLLKVLFPFYLLGPAIDTLLLRWNGRIGAFLKEMRRPVRTILYIAAPIALTWYGPNLVYVLGYLFRASYGDIAAHYGDTRVWHPAIIFSYWSLLSSDGPSYYYVLAGLGLGILLAIRLGWRVSIRRLTSDPARRAVALWLMIPFFVSTFGVNKDIRFMAPALPALALLLAGALEKATRGRKTRALILAAFFLIPLNQFIHQTFGTGIVPSLTTGGIRLFKEQTNYSGPPINEGLWRQEELVDSIHGIVGAGPTVVAVGLEHPYLNANNLSYFSAKKSYPIKFVSYGYAEIRIERTVARLRDKEVDWLLLVDGVPEGELPEGVRAIDPQLRALISSGILPFARTASFQLSRDISASLWRRTGIIRMRGGPAPK